MTTADVIAAGRADIAEDWAEWTREGVEARLIAAFKALPYTPLYGRASRVRRADGRASPMTQVLSWLDLVEDRDDRKFLATWARCRAEGESFAARCVGMGWPQATAERGRRRAAAAISATLALRGGASAVPPSDIHQTMLPVDVLGDRANKSVSENIHEASQDGQCESISTLDLHGGDGSRT